MSDFPVVCHVHLPAK